MFGKIEILLIILSLLAVFYLVISMGAGRRNKKTQSPEIKKYLFGVRILIIIIGLVSIILWLFAY